MFKPFSGLTVIDLSTVLAGPSVSMFFAELGARVVKIENPVTGGDVTRKWKLPSEDPGDSVSAYFSSVNYGKSYLWLNLEDQEAREELYALIKSADLLITNFKSGDESKFGLEWDQLRLLNPRLIHGKVKGYDSQDDRIAYDVVLQAETGYMYMNGTAESGPVKMPVAMIDVLAAHQLKEGILCALLERDRTGSGMIVETSLERSGLASLVNQASNYLMTGHVPKSNGSLHPNIAPYGELFEASDKMLIVLAVGSDRQFRQLCAILNEAHLADDPRFSTNPQRVVHRKALYDLLQPLFQRRPGSEWMKMLIEQHVPAGEVCSLKEVMQNPVAQSMIREEIIEDQLTKRLSGVAFTVSAQEK